MKSPPFKKKHRGKPNLVRAGRSFEAQNRAAAEAILSDPLAYVGVQLKWAQLWTKNHPPEAPKVKRVKEVEQGSLW